MREDEGIDVGALLADCKETERVMQEAVREAILLHKQTGHPIVSWRDGKVVWIPPEEIVIPPFDGAH